MSFCDIQSGDLTFYPMILLLLLLPGILGDTSPHPASDPHVSCTEYYWSQPKKPLAKKRLLAKKNTAQIDQSDHLEQGSSPAVLYLPLGGGVSPGCQSAAGAKLTQVAYCHNCT